MRRHVLILCLTLFPSLLCSQTQWVLQEYLRRIGKNGNENLGRSVTGIGDFNQDNKPDVAVSQYDSTGLWYITTNTDTLPKKIFFGGNLLTGDLNGDGHTDFVLSGNDTVNIYWGTPTGIDSTSPTKIHGESPDDEFGAACIGNLIGDGTSDLVVTATNYPTPLRLIGKVYIYRGGTAFDTIPAVTITGDSDRYTLGTSCAIGDINDDGYNDLSVRGEFQYGQDADRWHYVDIWFGGVTFDTVRDFRMRHQYPSFGDVKIFDLNGDGKRDLIWATADPYQGIYVHYGRTWFDTIPDIILRVPSFGSVEFSRIIDAGDMDGDGYHDMAVGDPYAFQSSGFVFVYRGGPALDTIWDAGKGRADASMFGSSMDTVGDVNGDGLSDIIIGAPEYAFSSNQGYFGIFLGNRRITKVEETPGSILPQIARLEQNYPNPFNPKTDFRFQISEFGSVTLKVFDLLGRTIATLADEKKTPGSYSITWDATSMLSGIYYYQLRVITTEGEFYSDTKKMALIK